MTKQYIRSLVKNVLRQIDKTDKYHDTLIDHVLEQAINQVYYTIHESAPRQLGQYTKRFSGKDVATDAVTGRYYVDLPVRIVAMPDKRGGVRSIMSEIDTDVYFTPVGDQELLLMEEAESDALTMSTPIVIPFVVRPDVIEFKNMSATIAAGHITLDLLVAFVDLADTDNIPLPLGKSYDVIRMALEMLGVTPPKDLIDNNGE